MRICIYTAIYGGYDSLKPQPKQSIPADFICFTDADLEAPAPWIAIRDMRLPDLHPRLRAKWHRTHPHSMFPALPLRRAWRWFLKRYTHTIWIDGSVQLTSRDFAKVATESAQRTGWAMFAHPRRNCIYDEFAFSLSMLKYREQPMAEQVQYYRAEGFPEHAGLMATGIIVRQTNRQDIAAANEDWWQENLRWSYQDQLSLPFVFWRRGMKWDVIPGNLWSNDLFRVLPHHMET